MKTRQVLEEIAKRFIPEISERGGLEIKNNNSDFIETSVWTLEKVLEKAYESGYVKGYNAGYIDGLN